MLVTYLVIIERKGQMSKLTGAIYEIHHMDAIANRDQWVNRIHPLVKLVITLIYIITVVSVGRYNLSGIIIMGVYPIAVFILGDISFSDSLKRIRMILPLVCIVGIFNPFFDRQALFMIGRVTVTTGMISMLTLILKGIYAVLASYLLIATTTIEKICYALRMLHISKILVTQILLTYRYISVLLQEVNRTIQAYSLRAPNQKGVHFKVWGSMVGQLLLRSIDRAGVVYESMTLRGFSGEFYYSNMDKCKKKDYVYFGIWMLVFGVLKFQWVLFR